MLGAANSFPSMEMGAESACSDGSSLCSGWWCRQLLRVTLNLSHLGAALCKIAVLQGAHPTHEHSNHLTRHPVFGLARHESALTRFGCDAKSRGEQQAGICSPIPVILHPLHNFGWSVFSPATTATPLNTRLALDFPPRWSHF